MLLNRIAGVLRPLALVLANGYIFIFYSERVWYGVVRPGDTIGDYAFTWIVYSLSGYLLLAVIQWLRVRTRAALVIAGGMLGWLVEGVWASTVYGMPDLPFPLTIVITALSWHSLVTVMIGWYAMRRAFTQWSLRRAFAMTVGLGLLWGVWAPFEWTETPAIVPSPVEFAAHALATSVLLVVAYWALERLHFASWMYSRAAAFTIVGLHVIFLALVNFPALGWKVVVVLPLLLASGFALLLLDQRSGSGPDLITQLYEAPAQPRRFALVLLMPVVATLVYGAAWTLRESWWHIDAVLFVASGVLGFAAFLASVIVIVRRTRARRTA